jgi:hypothetical protein
MEGLPAIALGCAYHKLLPAGPRSAWFLSPRQRSWLVQRLEAETKPRSASAAVPSALASVMIAARNWRVWYLAVVVRPTAQLGLVPEPLLVR